VAATAAAADEEVDVVVIGSGIAGLSCAGLLASRGYKVAVLEQHYEIGGCAHEFNVNLEGRAVPSEELARKPEPVFKFEAGPSLYSGLSPSRSPNPLKHVFQMIGEEPEWINYDTWGAHLPEVPEGYELSIGAENFMEILRRYGGPTAREDWDKLAAALRPLSSGVMSLPSTAVRGDLGVLVTLGLRYPKAFIDVVANASKITAPFDLESYGVRDAFLKNYLDLIAFLLQGLPCDGTLTAVMAYMVEDFYRPDAIMDFPKGGSGAIAAALARGVTKHSGCSVRTGVTVEEVLIEDGRATGVKLRSGKALRARKAVVSNADLHNTFSMIPPGAHAGIDEERAKLLAPAAPVYSDDVGPTGGAGLPLCKSFMHLHLGVRADALPPDVPPQWTVVNSWDVPIDAPGNVIVVSVPSLLDPSLAPDGHHVIHAYTAGNEPFHIWEKFEGVKNYRADPEYKALKEERAAPMWEAIKRRAPDIEKGVVVRQIGTPLTHARFLKRHRGNYGLAIAAGRELKFPEVKTPLPGLFRCGDSTTAGIGVPAVASSGAQCANALLSVFEQLEMNEKIKMP
jgi:phytoene dehydrogenase-like protein